VLFNRHANGKPLAAIARCYAVDISTISRLWSAPAAMERRLARLEMRRPVDSGYVDPRDDALALSKEITARVAAGVKSEPFEPVDEFVVVGGRGRGDGDVRYAGATA